MRIPNMCLVLKLDNGKGVSIADEQTESQTNKTTQYRILISIPWAKEKINVRNYLVEPVRYNISISWIHFLTFPML